MAALRPTACLTTTPMKPLPSISFVSSISTSSPLTSDTDTPISPAMRALMPTSFSRLPFTVNESNAKLCASTPGLPAFACAPVNIKVPKVLSSPVIMISGLGKPRTRIAVAVELPGKDVGEEVAAVALIHREAPGARLAGAANGRVDLLGEQAAEAIPVVRRW